MPNTSRKPPEPGAGGGLSSVDNALILLQAVGERQALRVAEAADLLGVARSTAHRLLTALRQRGFVTQDKPNGVYRPGPALSEIGLAAVGRIDIRQAARPVLEELRDQTQETVSLSLLEGVNIRFVDGAESPRTVRVGTRTGVVLPAHCTAAGKAILAALPPAELQRRYPERQLTARTPGSITQWSELERELAEIRQAGCAYNLEEGEEGISAVGAAVRDLAGMPLVGIGIVVPASRMPDRETAAGMSAPLRAAAERIERSLHA